MKKLFRLFRRHTLPELNADYIGFSTFKNNAGNGYKL
jgi:hypothetical protein